MPFAILGLMILAYCAELKQCSTYEDVMSAVLAPWVKVVAEVCIIVYMFGCCTTFLIIIGEQISDSECLNIPFHVL